MLLSLRKSVLYVLCLFSLFVLKLRWDQRTIYRTASGLPPLNHILSRPLIDVSAQIKFWRALEFVLTNNGPGIPRPDQNGSQPNVNWDPSEEHFFPELIEMSDEELDSMIKGHENYIKGLKVHGLELVYKPNTKGIVCTAGGSYLPLVTVTLRILQTLGSTLPMEIFLQSGAEYESYVCEKIFPPLNARCIILSEILSAAPHPVEIGHFQLKLFALLFSSFEDVLFLDADCFPARDPAALFAAPPYTTHGMVLWPDFWYATPSKHVFEITDWERVPNSRRPATESGEMLISKRTHQKTLLMAAYYNYWGPEHYYPLFAQGGPGEGDKDTFLPAAEVAGEPVYQVAEKVVAISHAGDDGNVWGSAMVQFDPAEDYNLTSQGVMRAKDTKAAPSPRPAFVHVTMPKFNPGKVFDEWGLLHWDNGSVRRAWIDPMKTMESFERDVERIYWDEARWVACAMEDRFRDWYGLEDVCRKAEGYWEAMFGG